MFIFPALLVVLSTCSLAMALPAESNGQRLARGLSPMRSKFDQVHPNTGATPSFVIKRSVPSTHPVKRSVPSSHPDKRAVPSPHPIKRSVPSAHPIKRSVPSAHPTEHFVPSTRSTKRSILPAYPAKRSIPLTHHTTFSGQIEVRDKDGYCLGTVRNRPGKNPINGVDTYGHQHSLHITFTIRSQPDFIDIHATNALFDAPFFIGLRGSDNISGGPPNSLELSNVHQTTPGSPPINGEESAIWSFDYNTQELTPHWINPDGSKPKIMVAFDHNENEFIITGDLDEWLHEHRDVDADEVFFFFAPF